MFPAVDALAATVSPVAAKVSRSIAVSVPSVPTEVRPGETSKIRVRVVNPGSPSVTVTVTGRGLEFGDDGKVNVTAAPDPQWAGRIDFPARDITVPAGSFDDVFLTVRMPMHIAPDLYFIGFVVSPVPSALGKVVLINQIGAFVTIDVPGPRDRTLSAQLHVPGFRLGPIQLSSVTVGSQTAGEVRVHNVGTAQVQFWGWNETRASFGRGAHQQRIDKLLLPTGRARSFAITGKPAWPIDFVAMKVYLIYPDKTETATKQIVLTKRVLVVNPWVLVAIGALTVLAASWLRRRHKRNKIARGPSSSVAHGRRAIRSQTAGPTDQRRSVVVAAGR